jgi:hypothetical protein
VPSACLDKVTCQEAESVTFIAPNDKLPGHHLRRSGYVTKPRKKLSD